MEKIIHHQLVKALESHNLISNYQHGFHGRRSTVSLLLTAIHDWAACLERCHSVHCIFLDLATGPPTGWGGGGGLGHLALGPIKGPLNTCLKDRYTLIEQSDLNTLIEQSQYSSEEQCRKLIDKEIWLVRGSYCHC